MNSPRGTRSITEAAVGRNQTESAIAQGRGGKEWRALGAPRWAVSFQRKGNQCVQARILRNASLRGAALDLDFLRVTSCPWCIHPISENFVKQTSFCRFVTWRPWRFVDRSSLAVVQAEDVEVGRGSRSKEWRYPRKFKPARIAVYCGPWNTLRRNAARSKDSR